MSKFRLPLLVVFVVTVAGCAGPAQMEIAQQDLDKMGLQEAWYVPYENHGTGKPLVVKDIMLFKNVAVLRRQDDTLEAFNRSTGLARWAINLEGRIIGEPHEHERFIYIVAGRYVYELDQLSGYSRNKHKLDFVPTSGPIVSQKNIFVSSTDCKVQALSRLDGTHMWVKNALKPIRFRSVLTEGQIVFSSLDLNIYSVNDTDGLLVWTFSDIDSPIAGPMVYRANRIYLTCRNGRVMAISRSSRDLYTRKVYWDWASDHEIFRGPKLGRGLLFIHDAVDTLYAFDITTGEGKKVEGPVWSCRNVNTVVASGKEFIYLKMNADKAGVNGYLAKLDIHKGTVINHIKLPPHQQIAENTLSGEILLVDNIGSIYSYKESNP